MSVATRHLHSAAHQAALTRALAAFGRAHQLQSALTWSLRLLAFGLALDALALLSRRLVPALDSPAALLLLPPLLGLLVGAALGLTRHPKQRWLAREIDARLGLRERTVTALELAGGSTAPLAGAQLEDALHHLRRADPLDAFPLRLPRREAVAALLLAILLAPLLLLASPSSGSAQGTSAERLALGEAERLEAIADEIEADQLMDQNAESAAQLAQMLREVAEGVRQAANDPDRAVAQLGDAERRMAQLQRPQAFDTAAALARLADALDRDQRTRPVSNALDRRDYQRAAQDMRQLGQQAETGSQADRQAISEALQRAAAATARYDERMAEALREAAQRAGQGEQGGTESAAQQMDRAGGEMRRQETLERALSQLQNSRQSVASGTRQDGSRIDPRADDRGNQPGQGEGQGQGQRGEGQGQPGAGSGQGEGQGDGEGGEGGGGAGTGSGNGSANVYDPAATRLRQVQVPGGDFDRPQMTEGEEQTDDGQGEVTVDYRDVLPTYEERATRAMQDRYVPLGMKDLVRDYFSSLGDR